MLNDLRYAFRSLVQNPTFALTAIISIALAIGSNSAIFSIADGLLFRPLPVPAPSRVVNLRATTPAKDFGNISYPDFVDFRDKSRSFEGLLAYTFVPAGFANDRDVQPQLKTGYLVSGDFFKTLGIEPFLGRQFRPEENQVAGRDAVVALSHAVWKGEFGSDPSIIGRKVRLNDLDFTIIAVLPESFTGIDHLFHPAFYAPIAMGSKFSEANQDLMTNRNSRQFFVKGRLAPGVSIQAAEAEIAGLAKSLEESNPSTNRAFGARVRTEMQFRNELDPTEAPLVGFLFAMVGVVLLTACANVANLMLNRGRARTREIAVRLAIGASRRRIIRELFAESLLIALIGGALGLFVTQYAVSVFSQLEIPSDLPIQFLFEIDYRVLGFTLAASMLSAILFGLTPALQSSRADLTTALKAGQADSPRKRLFGRRTLVAVQVAGAAALILSAAQLSHSLETRLYANHGLRTDHRITMRFAPTEAGYSPARTEQFYRTLLEHARNAPGVQSAALGSRVPLTNGGDIAAVVPEGYEFPAGQESVRVFTDYVGDQYFETFGIPVLAGRGFLATDGAESSRVAIVNEQFARHYFKGNPIGKRFRIGGKDPWVEIVGMTVTGSYFTIFEPPLEVMYLPVSQHPQQRMTLIVETAAEPAPMASPLREVVRGIDPNMPIFSVRTMDDLFEQRSVKIAHLFSAMVALLGAMGLVLALVGLYAVVSYQVTRRTREIGIRMALGASPYQVIGMVLRGAALMAVTGIGIGTALHVSGNLAMRGGYMADLMSPLSPLLFDSILAALLLTTLIAAAAPARRAARIDPQEALRQE